MAPCCLGNRSKIDVYRMNVAQHTELAETADTGIHRHPLHAAVEGIVVDNPARAFDP